MTSEDAADAKGPLSRVVRLKLRYKSATVDAFIEKYALDVSPRGIYVNIAKPLAVGTLVKLEIQLADERVIIKGAGTVVWHRDREHASSTQPAGLWIKFLKIDEPSKAFIETVTNARADAGLAYEEHAGNEAEDAAVVGSPAPSNEQAKALPVPAASRLRATLVGIAAPPTLPAPPRLPSLPPLPTPPPPKAASLPAPPVVAPSRLKATLIGIAAPSVLPPPRTSMASLPPIPTPPPPKARSLPPPPSRALEEQAETDAEDATVVWGEAPDASPQEATLMEVTAPPPLPPARPRMASLPPIPTPPPPKARSALPLPPAVPYEEPPEQDADEDTVIFDHEPHRQEEPAAPVPVAPAHPVVAAAPRGSTREASVKTTLTRRRSPSPQELKQGVRTVAWVALGFFATVALALAVRSSHWFVVLTTAAPAPVVVTGGGATSAAAPVTSPMTSAETEPVPPGPAVDVPADAAPASTTPADGAPPTTGTSPQAITVPSAAPGPQPAPVPRPINPAPVGIAPVRAKPKPKPAPTIDDGF